MKWKCEASSARKLRGSESSGICMNSALSDGVIGDFSVLLREERKWEEPT